jgi:hypothetical protein
VKYLSKVATAWLSLQLIFRMFCLQGLERLEAQQEPGGRPRLMAVFCAALVGMLGTAGESSRNDCYADSA